MKNKLTDLNNHLFAEIERLGDEDLNGDDLKTEIERARAITSVATQIINAGNLGLNAAKAMGDSMNADFSAPKMLLDE